MHSIVPIAKSSLVNLGFALVVLNVVVNVLDLVSSFIGFSRGMAEQDAMALYFMNILGNDYFGAVIIKALLMFLFILSYLAIRRTEKGKEAKTMKTIFALLLLDIVLAYLGASVLTTVEGNFIALGWL